MVDISAGDHFYSADHAIKYVDFILKGAPLYSSFRIEELIEKSTLDEVEKRLLSRDTSGVVDLMEQKLKYIQLHRQYNLLYELTELGRIVKKAGGYNAYEEQQREMNISLKERERLNDEKLRYDLKNVKRVYRTYWLTFCIATLGFLLAVGKIIWDVISSYN